MFSESIGFISPMYQGKRPLKKITERWGPLKNLEGNWTYRVSVMLNLIQSNHIELVTTQGFLLVPGAILDITAPWQAKTGRRVNSTLVKASWKQSEDVSFTEENLQCCSLCATQVPIQYLRSNSYYLQACGSLFLLVVLLLWFLKIDVWDFRSCELWQFRTACRHGYCSNYVNHRLSLINIDSTRHIRSSLWRLFFLHFVLCTLLCNRNHLTIFDLCMSSLMGLTWADLDSFCF